MTMCHQTDMTSQPDKVPPCQQARLIYKCVGGVINLRQSQDGAAAAAATLSLTFQLDTSQRQQPSLSSVPLRHVEMAQGVKLKP